MAYILHILKVFCTQKMSYNIRSITYHNQSTMEPTTQDQTSGNKSIIAGVIVILLIIGGVFAVMKLKNNSANLPSTTPTDTTSANPSNTPVVVNTKYKDGTYTAEGLYQSPGGAESIDVTLVLKDDVVVDATVVAKATRPASVDWQGKFVSGFKQYVVGKNIASLSLSKVSGSSLTPKGFNDAVAKIEVQAKS